MGAGVLIGEGRGEGGEWIRGWGFPSPDGGGGGERREGEDGEDREIGRASCRERVSR